MKKLIPLMALALVVLFGCAKEEPTPNADDQQVSESSINVLISDGETEYWETISLEELQGNSGSGATSRSNSAHTHGEFTAGDDPEFYTTFTFSGTQNNGGPHGSAEVIQVRPNGTRHFIMETVCVGVEGDEAVYGGVITEVIENTIPNPPPPPPPPPCPTFPNCPPPPPPCDVFSVGSNYYFRVIDNGQGNNAPSDQFYTFSLATCGVSNDCFLNSFPWFFFPINDVANESDKIKVNN